MRRVTFLIVLIALFFPSSRAFAATAGSTCPKVGAKVSQGKVALICKKNAKGKAVWTSVKPLVPRATPAPTASPRALEIWEVTQKILDAKWEIKTSVASPIQIEYQNASVVPNWARDAISYVQPSLDFFNELGMPITSQTKLVVGDFEYVRTRIRDLGCPNIGADQVSDNCAPGVLFLNVTPSSLWNNIDSVLIHEMFHQAQSDAAIAVGRNRYFYPLWLRQGGAELMHHYVYGKLKGLSYAAQRQSAVKTRESNCENFTLRGNVSQGRTSTEPISCDYTGGFFTAERLVALYGNPQALVEWVRRTDVNLQLYTRVLAPSFSLPSLTLESYDAAVEKIYGTPTADFERAMEAYVRKAIFG